jgi:general stress protein YciG
MSGSRDGGLRAAASNKERHGEDFYKRIGAMGGRWTGKKGFALSPERARLAGQKGGKISRRTKRESNDNI